MRLRAAGDPIEPWMVGQICRPARTMSKPTMKSVKVRCARRTRHFRERRTQSPAREKKRAYVGAHPKEPCAHSEGSGPASAVRRQRTAGDPVTLAATGNKGSGCTDDGRGGCRYWQ